MKKTIILLMILIVLYAGLVWAGGLDYWMGFSSSGGGVLAPPVYSICGDGSVALTGSDGVEIIGADEERICLPE